MALPTTDFFLPPDLPYPITLVSFDAGVGAQVVRGTRLLSYSFVYKSKDPDTKPTTHFGTWDSITEGKVERWNYKTGDVISAKEARQRSAVVIEEPCKHGVQFGGMCALCGKDMDVTDYTGFSESSRASIQMTHSAFGPTVSLEEAQRIERETAQHLLESRKLSLIVDLDQTIVHATVDPTVGEWIQEGEAWEAKQAKKQNKSSTPDSDDSDVSSDEDDDDEECNPNWDAIKDVKKFRLGPESFVPPSARQKGKNKMVEADGCIYYIKPRPGWKEFLEEAASKYEMHVYTMGTRAYAEQVCAVIDPDRKLFGDRLLSRDESGSLTQKSLQRLFPCDTSMVVIIDDRADVWEWSPNLVKVIPYDFFVGIGDINSTFLPKVDPSTPASIPNRSSTPKPPSIVPAPASNLTTDSLSPEDSTDAGGDEATAQTSVLLTQNNAALSAQVEDRPLAKKEKELQEHENDSEHTPAPAGASEAAPPPVPDPQDHHHHRKPLLRNDDTELIRVGKLLDEVHSRFFAAHTSKSSGKNRDQPGSSKREADVTRIIPRIREDTLKGCHILFSGIIPLDRKPETVEIWTLATMFGAKCHTTLNHHITHVVAAKPGTVKVDQARKRADISIVSQAWLADSIAHWRRMEEKPYIIAEPLPDAPTLGAPPYEPSSDEESRPVETHSPKSPVINEEMSATVDWGVTNDEVDGWIEESDDEEEEMRANLPASYLDVIIGDDDEDEVEGEGGEMKYSDDESVKSVNSTTSPNKRKRLRSVTPSDAGVGDADDLRSPLAKRKKLVADRSGLSRLKEGVSASEIAGGSRAPSEIGSAPGTPRTVTLDDLENNLMAGDDEEGSDFAGDFDDFLARELEEDWG